MFCKKCAAEIKEGSAFCEKCGEKVGATSRKSKKELIYIFGALLAIVAVIFIYTSSKNKNEMPLVKKNTPKGVVERMMKSLYEDNFKLYRTCISEEYINEFAEDEDITYDEAVKRIEYLFKYKYYLLKLEEYKNEDMTIEKAYTDDDYARIIINFDDDVYAEMSIYVYRDDNGKWYIKDPMD